MKIKRNIKFISLIPIFLVITLSLYIGISEYFKFEKIKNVPKTIQKIETFHKLLLSVSKERKYVIKSIITNTDDLELQLNKQIEKTNALVKDIVTLYNQNKEDKLIFKIVKDIRKIVSLRKQILDKSASYDKIFATYDNLNSDILSKISTLKTNVAPNIDNNIQSYIKSISLIKAISDERDFIAKNYNTDANMDSLYMVKIFKDSNVYQTFLLLDEDIKKLLSNYLNNKNFLKLIETTNKIKKDILNKGFHQDYTISKWYNLEDKKLQQLEKVITLIKQKIQKDSKLEAEISLTKIIISSLVFLLSLFMLVKYFKITKHLFDTHYLKLLLQKSVDTNLIQKKIDLDTTEGIQEAYKLIDISLDKIEIDRQKAQNENASKSIFLANMSHEIRTPINGIVGFTDLLKKSNLTTEQREYIEIISKSTDNLLEIINNILDLSKIESKKVEIDTITFSPIEEFENSVNLFIAKAAKKNIDLSLIMDIDFKTYLLGDSLKLKEILLNLISNAIKFTPDGGKIEVKIKKENSSDIDKERIYFEVTDNGIGMNEEELSEVFEAFTQANSTITRKYGGTGLGLTISSNYVSLMGGNLEVYSKKNKGTSFFFTLEFKKSQPLKIYKYKDSFKEVKPLVISDEFSVKKAEYLANYLNFFTSNATYIKINQIEQNISLFDRANLIVITKDIYDKNDFSYLEKTDKKLLVVNPTKMHEQKPSNNSKNTIFITEPLSFFKMVEVLTILDPKHNGSYLSYHEKIEKMDKKDYKILIAEDNDINMKLIKQIFNQYKNIHITEALNGQEAIDSFMKERFDLILMDIAMPIVDGISATQKIKEYENINNLTHTPIIALTANALKGDKEKFLSEGLDEYLTKPIKEDELVEMLNKFGITLSKESFSKTENLQNADLQNKTKNNLPEKEILIYKKSIVETKIFQKVLRNLYEEIDISKNTKEFLDKIKDTKYQAILLDTELNDLDIDKLVSLKQELKDTSFILFRNFETKIDNRLRTIFDEIVINSADEEYLKTILENYVKKEEKEVRF